MTAKELIRKYCKPVLESKFLEKMEDKVLNYRIDPKISGPDGAQNEGRKDVSKDSIAE